MTQWVIVGQDGRIPGLAIGPFDNVHDANTMIGLLEKTTSGKHTLLVLHTPTTAVVPESQLRPQH